MGMESADLYVYRREDKGFADAVARHFDEFIKHRGTLLTGKRLADALGSEVEPPLRTTLLNP
jgi:hypothetical protein